MCGSDWMWLSCYSKVDDGRVSVRRSIVTVDCSALKRVIFADHILADNKNRSICDCSINQVRPLIRRLWVAFCWTMHFVSRFIGRLSRSYLQIFWCICNADTSVNKQAESLQWINSWHKKPWHSDVIKAVFYIMFRKKRPHAFSFIYLPDYCIRIYINVAVNIREQWFIIIITTM